MAFLVILLLSYHITNNFIHNIIRVGVCAPVSIRINDLKGIYYYNTKLCYSQGKAINVCTSTFQVSSLISSQTNKQLSGSVKTDILI